MCTKCGIQKPISEFFTRDKQTGRLHAQCKMCYREHRASYYISHYAKYRAAYLLRAKTRRERLRLEFRKNIYGYMSTQACAQCGIADIRVLELDHLDPKTKRFTISQAVKLGYSWNDVLAEIKKCQILCANCHKIKTAQQSNWYKAL